MSLPAPTPPVPTPANPNRANPNPATPDPAGPDPASPGLAALEARLREDLARLDYPAPLWVPPRHHAGMPVLDVLIVGGGQGGLATAFGLLRERVTNILVVDRAPPGREGPWISFARMETLRTPKHVSGPDLGVPSLTPRAWYEARFGTAAWDALGKIPREHWQAYLVWFRRVLALPVRNGVAVTALAPVADVPVADVPVADVPVADAAAADTPAALADALGVAATLDGLLAARLDTGETLLARKVVLATGIEGSGAWHVPDFIRHALPRERWMHTAEPMDPDWVRGRRVGVLGAGASAFDNAATALEAGAATVSLCLRRSALPRVNPYRWMESAGFLGQFAELPAAERWRFQRHVFALNQPPPAETLRRCTRHPGFSVHVATPWLGARMEGPTLEGGAVRVRTPGGEMAFDRLILGTGFRIALAERPELSAFAGRIALWRDRFVPPPGEEDPVLASYPFLGRGFEFTEREPGTAPFLRNLHNFTFGATLSMGLSGASISGLKFGVRRLVDALVRDLFVADAARHYASLLAYDTPELTPDLLETTWPASPPTSWTPPSAAPPPASPSASTAWPPGRA